MPASFRLLPATCAAAVLMAASLPVLAERARLGDEAEVSERGDCELEWAMRRERERERERRAARRHGRSLELGCGVGGDSEVSLALQRDRGSEGERESAAEIELKTVFAPRAGAGIGWSLIAGARRERAPQVPSRWAEQSLAVAAAQEPAAGWRVEARLGTQRNLVERRDRSAWEIALEHALSERWEARMQLAGEDRNRPQWALALRWQFWPDQVALTLRHGGSMGSGRTRQSALAVAWEI